jgi:DNA-binding response OmpR family regulator
MKRRILLVDDELAILLTLRAILEINGFEVETAISAKEGISKLKANTYNMVITDMRMETDNAGLDVIRAARKQEYNPATAILTAFPTLGGDWKSAGADQMLVKPMNTDELLSQIEFLLTQHRENQTRGKKTIAKKAMAATPKSARSESPVPRAG